MDTKEVKPLITEKLCRPLWLLWAMILPQAGLILINLSFWSLVKGEMSADQKQMAFVIFASELAILALGIFVSGIFHFLKKSLGLIVCGLLFLVHIAYLWLITAWGDKLLPSSVTIWILPPDEVLYYQYILIVPALFYTGLRLSCFTPPIQKAADVSLSAATLILVPLCSYLFMTGFYYFFRFMDIPTAILTLLFIGATAITMMAFLRVLTYIYLWLNHYKAGHLVLLLAVGLAGPLAGLALNYEIPFPYDFQSHFVELLAFLNGVILLLSFKEGTRKEVLGWFLRCLMYPFTLYFFLVFLPFLPLSLLAMIVVGSGFLILVPTALFIVHTRKIADEGRRVALTIGWKPALLLFTVAFAVIPAIISTRALLDRHSLMRAVDVVYNPDYTAKNVGIEPESVKRSLLKLRDMKNGIFLPFISSFYNQVVFGGMVLPDYKMNEMYRMFFGQEMPEEKSSGRFDFTRRANFRNSPVTMPERNVEISDIIIKPVEEGEFTKTEIQLTLTNKGSAQSEFVTEIQLDEGVMVSGYWLKIGDEKAAGRIFEKKAAMWIYHMIRDVTRRDPGLLIYQTDNSLKLSVYPFAENEQRITGIELLYPAGMHPSFKIGDEHRETLGDLISAPKEALLAKTEQGQTSVIIPNEVIGTLPSVQRKPYLHFIVDGSLSARDAFPSFGKRMTEIAAKYGQASQCKITLANYEIMDITNGLIGIKEIEKVMNNAASKSIDFKGAFCYPKVIKQELLKFQSTSNAKPDDGFSVPIFVVISAAGSKFVSIGQMSAFARLVPDIENYYISSGDNGFFARTFGDQENVVSEIEIPAPVVVLQCGDSSPVYVRKSGWGFVMLSGGGDDTLKYYDMNTKNFTSFVNVRMLSSDTPYIKGLAAWEKYRQTVYSPVTLNDELPEIVKMSRDCGIMTPLTSYIVLENSAQLEMLKRKEKQGLSANQALEFDEFMESPAPPVLLLVPFAVVLLLKIRRSQRICGT